MTDPAETYYTLKCNPITNKLNLANKWCSFHWNKQKIFITRLKFNFYKETEKKAYAWLVQLAIATSNGFSG